MITIFELIDTETGSVVATAHTEAEALSHTPYEPSDCVPGADTWDEVLKACVAHADGVPGIVEGYATRRVEIAPGTYDAVDNQLSFANLDELYLAMRRGDSRTLARQAESVSDWSTDLPLFGDRRPTNPDGVWSWDDGRAIVGTCPDDLEILPWHDEAGLMVIDRVRCE